MAMMVCAVRLRGSSYQGRPSQRKRLTRLPELWYGVPQELLVDVGPFFVHVHYAGIEVVLHLCQVPVARRGGERRWMPSPYFPQGAQAVQREVVALQFVGDGLGRLPYVGGNAVPAIVEQQGGVDQHVFALRVGK